MKHAKTLFAITALSAALSSALWPGMASAAPAATVSAETWFGAEPASSGPALSRAEVQRLGGSVKAAEGQGSGRVPG